MSEALPDLLPEGGDPRAPLAERIARAIWIEIKRTRVVVCCAGGVHLSVSAAMLKPIE